MAHWRNLFDLSSGTTLEVGLSGLGGANAYDGGTRFLDIPSYANVGRWIAELDERVPVRRGLKVNLTAEGFARERHSAADIDAVLAG